MSARAGAARPRHIAVGAAITQRDLALLEFVARFGLVSASAAAHWAGTRRSVTYQREGRLRDNGLLHVLPSVGGSGRLLVCTREGLRTVGREELKPCRPTLGRIPHLAAVANVAAELERQGQPVLSELELIAVEALQRRWVYSAELGSGRSHRADLVLVEGPIAVEVELSQKPGWRLDEIMRGWRTAIGEQRVGAVCYLCSERALGAVRRSVERTHTEELVEVARLDPSLVAVSWEGR